MVQTSEFKASEVSLTTQIVEQRRKRKMWHIKVRAAYALRALPTRRSNQSRHILLPLPNHQLISSGAFFLQTWFRRTIRYFRLAQLGTQHTKCITLEKLSTLCSKGLAKSTWRPAQCYWLLICNPRLTLPNRFGHTEIDNSEPTAVSNCHLSTSVHRSWSSARFPLFLIISLYLFWFVPLYEYLNLKIF